MQIRTDAKSALTDGFTMKIEDFLVSGDMFQRN
jgi:hypothetical protein